MAIRILSKNHLEAFVQWMHFEEKSSATCEKYLRDIRRFMNYAAEEPVSREVVVRWKNDLIEQGYAVRSINSMLASLNSLLHFLGWEDCKAKNIRLQHQTFSPEEKELSRAEYQRLLQACEDDIQINLLLQTICATGIRVSELQYFTVSAIKQGQITVNCKGKIRTIMIPGKLKRMLLQYAKQLKLSFGPIFCNQKGEPLDRSVIWRRMKRLCQAANVQAPKVFPHNLRKLFARTYYGIGKDIAQLADVLGHSSINTTRIYIMTSGAEHRRNMERLGLVMWKNSGQKEKSHN
jgi:site-specific recombinase XerD